MPSRASSRAPSRAFVRIALLCFATTVVFAACGDDETESSRKGGEGDSCTRTDDCESPLNCINSVCTSNMPGTGGGDGGGGSGGSGGATGGGGAGDGGVGPGQSLGACDDCLDNLCETELDACGPDCLAIEACIEATCRSIADASEGECQVSCQNAHPSGEAAHLAVVNCAFEDGNVHTCQMGQMPCGFYPDDFDTCRTTMAGGACKTLFDGCNDSAECGAYRSCTDGCTSNSACQMCGATVAGQTGRQQLIELETCIARECMSESWLP